MSWRNIRNAFPDQAGLLAAAAGVITVLAPDSAITCNIANGRLHTNKVGGIWYRKAGDKQDLALVKSKHTKRESRPI